MHGAAAEAVGSPLPADVASWDRPGPERPTSRLNHSDNRVPGAECMATELPEPGAAVMVVRNAGFVI